MTHYPDLSPCVDFGGDTHRVLNVGCLAAGHAYARGAVSATRFKLLVETACDAWHPVVLAGSHGCPFCVFTRGPREVFFEDRRVDIGGTYLIVPGAEALYVAPMTILHSIDAHEYAPPEEFWVALETSPPQRSVPYFRAMLRFGMGEFLRSKESGGSV